MSLYPEVGIGLPITRETIRLIGDIANPKAFQSKDSSEDYTQQLAAHAAEIMTG